MSIRSTVLYSVLAASATLVRAHGSVNFVGANGMSWGAPFPDPNTRTDNDSPVRQLADLVPVRDKYSSDIMCGIRPAGSAQVTMEVTAGTYIDYGWRSGEDTNWPHLLGPITLFAYKCPGLAKDCNPSGDDKGWALIDAVAYDLERNDQEWVQKRFNQGEKVSAMVPEGMPDGEYLFRHEIIGLHVIPSESYPSCTQVKITGGSPANMTMESLGADVVSFPGAYGDGDPGLTANVFGGVNKDTYQMPGPKRFNPKRATPAPEPPTTTTTTTPPAPTSPAPDPSDPAPTPSQCTMTRKQRRELRQAREAKRKAKRAAREAHQRELAKRAHAPSRYAGMR